jgi:hypothetical protein
MTLIKRVPFTDVDGQQCEVRLETDGEFYQTRSFIYCDRIELQSWVLLHTVVLPTDEIRPVEVRPSAFGGWKGLT